MSGLRDERADSPPQAIAVFWQILAASGEVAEPRPAARFFGGRVIGTFEQWAPLR